MESRPRRPPSLRPLVGFALVTVLVFSGASGSFAAARPRPGNPAASGALRAASGRSPPAHARRRERRGLLVAGRQGADPPGARRGRRLRPDLPPRGGRIEAADPRFFGQGEDHLLVFPPRQPGRHLRVDPPRRRRVPAEARLLEGLRLGPVPRVRHLRDGSEDREARPADVDARLRRRGDDFARRKADRIHVRS